MVEKSRQERLAIFISRIDAAPAASNFDEAFGQIHDVLTTVETEFSGVPHNPEAWATDGRLYPPMLDSEKALDPPRPGVRLFTTRGHSVYIGVNGAIEIRRKALTLWRKPGADGRYVEEL